jgi:hypothetical protein
MRSQEDGRERSKREEVGPFKVSGSLHGLFRATKFCFENNARPYTHVILNLDTNCYGSQVSPFLI